MATKIRISRASIYLDAAVVRRYFPGMSAVIVMVRDGKLCVLPVHGAAFGGYLLKTRNVAGDCVICAPDVFAAHGWSDCRADDVPAEWSAEAGGLVVDPACFLERKFAKGKTTRHSDVCELLCK